jgi:hypothetical protein
MRPHALHLRIAAAHPTKGGKEMLTLFRSLILALVLVPFAFIATDAAPSKAQSASQVPITVVVTALDSNFKPAPDISQDEVTAYSGSTRLTITRWVHAQGNNSNLQLAILIDNDLGTSLVGRQMGDLETFINSQPPATAIGVFYAENGAAEPVAPFSTDHAAAAKALRLTAGRSGGSPSIYLSLSDLAKRWTNSGNVRREALVVASGFDPLYPGIEDPYADAATDDAEKAGINVHIVLVPNPRYEQTFRDNISEGKLIQASTGTGGQDLFEGAFVPVSFTPFLANLNTALNNQYLLTFLIDRTDKKDGELRPLRVQLEQHGVKLYAPQKVLVPGP